MITTSSGKYPGTPLSIEEKKKKLYHFTNYEKFVSIWNTKELWFSSADNVNDLTEAIRIYHAQNPYQIYKMRDEIRLYKQISFIMDFDSYLKGAMSNTMWGYYGDACRGVCLEFDFDEIITNKEILHKEISYVDHYKVIDIPQNVDSLESVNYYIEENQVEIFFTKTIDWKGENEYRLLSKTLKGVDISRAITGVYITNLYEGEGIMGEKFEILDKKLGPSIPIYEYFSVQSQGNLIPNVRDARVTRQQMIDARNNKNNALNYLEDFFTDPFEKEK